MDTEKLRKGVKRRGHNLNKNPTAREAVLDVIRAIAKKYYGERLEKLQQHQLDPEERTAAKRKRRRGGEAG